MALLASTMSLRKPWLLVPLILLSILALRDLLRRYTRQRRPHVNPKSVFEITSHKSVRDFITRSRQILVEGRARFPNIPYNLSSDFGDVVVVPPRLIDEIGEHPDLSFTEAIAEDSHASIPGFEPFTPNEKVGHVVRTRLVRALAKFIDPISEESGHALNELLGDSTEWHQIATTDPEQVIFRVTSRVFLGEDFCRNEEWVKACHEYIITAFSASDWLRVCPPYLRPLIHWFLPSCRHARSKLEDARRVMAPHIERRQQMRSEARVKGEALPFDDAIEWIDQEFGSSLDLTTCQIQLCLVAIHTTSDLLKQVILDLAQNEAVANALRKEVIEVLSAEGLKKSCLDKLELMDSAIKESQRLKPVALMPIRRRVMKDITLSSGEKLYQGEKVVADVAHMWDPTRHENPLTYDPYRFHRMRQKSAGEGASKALLITTEPGHIAFGHGKYACPGRFFVASELKIVLCHLLLKYEWKLDDDASRPWPVVFGSALMVDPQARIMVRRRREELSI